MTYLYDVDAPLFARICAGVCLGFAVLGLVAFYLALFLKLTAVTLVLAATILACALLLLVSRSIRSRIRADIQAASHWTRSMVTQPRAHIREICLALLYLCLAVVLERLFSRAVFEQDGMIKTGAINNIGDLPLHTSIITSFAYGENFPPEHPEFAGAALTYPFLADFLTALFMHTGASLPGAMYLQTVLLMLALVGLAYRWALKWSDNSLAAVISVGLLLFNGGFGWWLLGDDLRRTGGKWLWALMHLSHEYTTEASSNLRWGNMLETILLPQRSFQMGLPLSLIVLTLWWQAVRTKPVNQSVHPFSSSEMRYMLGAGVVAGLLPLIHMTSYVVIMAMASCLMLLFGPGLRWVAFFATALLFSIPQILWLGYSTSVQAGNMFAWHVGWEKGRASFCWFWLKNTGIFIPALLVAIAWLGKKRIVPRRVLLFYLPFVLCFIVPNLFRLMPWIWDNIKYLSYWYIASVPLVALLLARLWRQNFVLRIVAVLAFVCMTAAGALDVWRVLAKSVWIEFDQGATRCAEMIKELCPPRALVLHAPMNNSAVYLTGRRSLLSIPFMVRVHGLNLESREADIQTVYLGEPAAKDLIAKYRIDYALIGPQERGFLLNEGFFLSYPIAGETDGYKLYRIGK